MASTITVALLTAPLSIPFEVARMAYYGDKTFPKEIRKNYSSYFNALIRIPFEEGPYYFYKNSFPFFMRNFFCTLTSFYTYDWLKDKFSFTHRVGQVPVLPFKLINAGFSTWLALIFAYPFAVTIREMVDFWPKEKGGVCTF